MASLRCCLLAMLLLLFCNVLAAAHETSASEAGVVTETSTFDAVESTAERSLQAPRKPRCPGNLTAFPIIRIKITKTRKGRKTIIKKTPVIIGWQCKCKPGFRLVGRRLCVKIPVPKPSPRLG